jgi:hypothetical protein
MPSLLLNDSLQEIAKLTDEIKMLEGRINRRPQDDKVKGWKNQVSQTTYWQSC